MNASKNKWGIAAKILTTICSGLLGVLLTLGYQHFFAQPTSFTFIYNGNEVQVTETDYIQVMEENDNLKNELKTAQEKIDTLQLDLSSFSDQIEERNSVDAINTLMAQASTYWKNEEYIQALTLLKNTTIQSEDIKSLYVDYSNKYAVTLLSEAGRLISEYKYDDATALLSNATPLVADPTSLQNRINEIGNHDPQKLSSMKISSSRDVAQQEEKSYVDTVGNSYSPGNLFTASAYYERYGFASFYLGKKYTSLSGTLAVADISADKGYSGWLEIYSVVGDNYTQIYKSPTLDRMTEPISLAGINVSGAEWVEIRFNNNNSTSNGFVVLISDVMLYSL